MTTWSPSLTPPWPPSELEAILEDALRLLEQIGVACTHPETLRRLRALPGISHRDGRLHFAVGPTREHVARQRHTGPAEPDDRRLTMGGCWAGLAYCDPETGDVRPSTTDEAIAMARLWESRGYGGVSPVQPGDVPPRLVTVTCERIGLLHSSHLGGSMTVTDPEEVRYLIAMNLAAGRRYSLVEQVPISPLRFDDLGLETAVQFLDNPDVEVHITSSIPMAGATCPLDPHSAMVQSVAEAIAHDLLCQALGLGPGGLGLRVEPFDFQYSFIVFGSPEWCLYRALVLQMQEFLTGHPSRGGMFRSVAKRPDEQAAAERTASVLWQALLGVRSFGAVGQLSVDEIFSPQQAVIDLDILAYVQRLITGLDLTPAVADPVALIAQGVAEGSFIGVEDTVRRFRDFYSFPELFRHWNMGRWRSEGMPWLLQEAWQRAQEEIAACTFALPEDRAREVERLHAEAVGYLRGG
jgi:trimethylamine:corrinoid methyltransferase-like protein